MFCSQCGSEVASADKFCANCGFSFVNNTLPGSSNRKSLSLEDYKRIKESQRQSRFEPKGKKSRQGKQASTAPPKDVAINIGMKKFENGFLKTIRGKSLPIRVPPNAKASLVKEKAVLKHTHHDTRLNTSIEYVLLYPDGSLVEKIPGTDQLFELEGYKEEVGKNYNRITLYLASLPDYQSVEMEKLRESIQPISSSESEEDEDVDLEKSVFEKEESVNPSSGGPSSVLSGATAGKNTVNEAGPSTSTATDDLVALVECPTCSKHFPLRIIADHADACADIWVGNLEEEDDVDPFGEEVPTLITKPNAGLKEIISNMVDLSARKSMKLRIRRNNLWVDVQKYGLKLSPDVPIKVEFIGEAAVDDGGPRREFFSEVLDTVKRIMFREGKPLPSTIALNKDDFLLSGKLMVMSIVQGGPAPAYLHPNIYAYLSGQLLPPEDNEGKYRDAALKIQSVDVQDQLADVLMSDDVFDVLEEIGYTGVVSRETLESAVNIIQSISIKSQLTNFMPQLMQLQQGLASCGLLDSVRENPKLWKAVFTDVPQASATIEEYLENLVASFSDSQLLKNKEIDVYKLFTDFIESLTEEGDLTVSHLLKWTTGSPTVPVLGFGKPFSVTFVHCQDGCRCRPTVSTCDIVVKLPVHIKNEEEMVAMMTSAIKDSSGFGLV